MAIPHHAENHEQSLSPFQQKMWAEFVTLPDWFLVSFDDELRLAHDWYLMATNLADTVEAVDQAETEWLDAVAARQPYYRQHFDLVEERVHHWQDLCAAVIDEEGNFRPGPSTR